MTKLLYVSCQQYSTFLKDTTSKLAKPEAQLQKQNVKLNTPTLLDLPLRSIITCSFHFNARQTLEIPQQLNDTTEIFVAPSQLTSKF